MGNRRNQASVDPDSAKIKGKKSIAKPVRPLQNNYHVQVRLLQKKIRRKIEFIKSTTLPWLRCMGDSHPVATQVPLGTIAKQDPSGGHMMRKTDHHLAFEKNNNVMVVFTGPHCANTQFQHGRATWNYMTVQAKGTMCFWMPGVLRGNAVKELSDNYVGAT